MKKQYLFFLDQKLAKPAIRSLDTVQLKVEQTNKQMNETTPISLLSDTVLKPIGGVIFHLISNSNNNQGFLD